MSNIFNITKEFSKRPCGRYKEHGNYSAERLREIILEKLNSSNDVLTIDVSGLSMFSSAFINECFGGMIRLNLISKSDLNNRIVFVTKENNFIIDRIKETINEY